MNRQKAPSLSWQVLDLPTPRSAENALWGVIVSYTGHPLLIDWLAQFIQDEAIPARQPKILAKALQRYSIDNIKYFRESPERFVSPIRTLQWKLGDCDDKTIFIATCLRSFKIPVKIKFIDFEFETGPRRHVLPFVFIQNKWYALESVTDFPFGLDPEIMANKKGIKTKSKFIGDKPYI